MVYMVNQVKFLMHLRLCGILQHNNWGRRGARLTDGAPLAKYWGPGLLSSQEWCPQYSRPTPNVATAHRHVRQDSRFSATIYQWLRDSLSVSDNRRGPCCFVDFRVTKFRQNVLQRHLKEKAMLIILAACRSGAPFQPGDLRTCVPCLMVNLALRLTPACGLQEYACDGHRLRPPATQAT